jgi:hypothetical protein
MKHIILASILTLFSFSLSAQKIHIGKPFNEVGNELSALIYERYGMAEVSNEMKDGIVVTVFKPKVFTGEKKSLVLSYKINDAGIVEQVTAEGDYKEVSALFTDYWKIKADYKPSNGIIAQKHFAGDVIRFSRKSGTTTALLVITGS